MKPTRTDDNKAPKSWAIRKWSMKQDEITRVAEELTKVPEIIQEVRAPAIESLASWNYEVYAWYTESVETLKKLFPQCKQVRNIAQNLKRTYGINYKYSDLWEYVFFDGETKDETIDRLDNDLIDIIREKNMIVTENYLVKKEKHDLQSDLYSTQWQRNQSLLLAILLFIYILISNYYG
jgi:hypothetical protein